MNSLPAMIAIAVVCQALIVVGQLFLKKSVGQAQAGHAGAEASVHWSRVIPRFAIGIACLSIWFFLWLGLMSRWDLSKLFPFEGLNPALMAIAAAVVLKERMPLAAWVGLGIVCVGIVIVAGS